MSDSPSKRILIVEDERALSLALAATVRHCGGVPEIAPSLAKAAEFLKTGPFRGMILDVGLPDGHGLSFLESIPTEQRPATLVVTAHGEIENAIVARKLGVLDFFDKPIDFEAFKSALTALLKNAPAAPELRRRDNHSTFIGAAPAMRSVFQKIAHACASFEPVLIVGDTGTGKTAAANLIAENTSGGTTSGTIWQPVRGGKPLSEAISECKNGVLQIDPITSLDLDTQAELVSLWESKSPDFPRVVATAPLGLLEMVGNGSFRSDLFYRLQVLEIRLPPLKERLDDIPVLVSYFLGIQEPERLITTSDSFCEQLCLHDWPGNLRELRNVVSYSGTVSTGSQIIEKFHLPDHILATTNSAEPGPSSALEKAIDEWLGDTEKLPSYREISGELERLLIGQLLHRFDGKLAPMAHALDGNRTTLRKKLKT